MTHETITKRKGADPAAFPAIIAALFFPGFLLFSDTAGAFFIEAFAPLFAIGYAYTPDSSYWLPDYVTYYWICGMTFPPFGIIPFTLRSPFFLFPIVFRLGYAFSAHRYLKHEISRKEILAAGVIADFWVLPFSILFFLISLSNPSGGVTLFLPIPILLIFSLIAYRKKRSPLN